MASPPFVHLSEGAIQEILDEACPPNPVVKILSIKKIKTKSEQYRVEIYDGRQSAKCMLSNNLNSKVKTLREQTVVSLDKYGLMIINHKRFIFILQLSTLDETNHFQSQHPQIPATSQPVPSQTPLHSSTTPTQSYPMSPTKTPTMSPTMTPTKTPSMSPTMTPTATPTKSYPSSSGTPSRPIQRVTNRRSSSCIPVAELKPSQSSWWTIRATVTAVRELRDFNTSRRGKVFSVHLTDESGTIKAAGFDEDAERLFPQLEINEVYFVSNGSIRTANKRYSSLKNDYEILFNRQTEVRKASSNPLETP